MPRQEAPFGSRSSVRDMNTTTEQVTQYYPTEGDRNAAFGTEEIPTTLITRLSDPPSESVRWARHSGDAWVPAMLEPSINCGWVSNLVVPDRTSAVKLTGIVRLNEPVPAGETYTVQYKTTDGTATAAENDFTAIPLTTLTFAEGEREKNITINVTGKGSTPQPPEVFYVDLSNPSEGSASFGIGGRLTISLTGDTSALVLTLADATVNEGQSASVVASINREATGDFTFTWSTRQQVSAVNRAPASLYTAVASASGTIAEGATSVNLVVQTNEVNAQVTLRNQYFDVIVPQTSLAVAGGDTIAAAGHDLEASVNVARNQYVAPTNTWTPTATFLTGTGSNRGTPASFPSVALRGDMSSPNLLQGAHLFVTISGLYLRDDDATGWFLIQPRELRIDIGVSPSIIALSGFVPIIPDEGDGTDPFYTKDAYPNLRRDTSRQATATFNRASGIRLPGNVETYTITF